MARARFARNLLLLLAIVAGIVYAAVHFVFERPLTLPASPFPLEVRAGSTLSAVASDLAERGAIAHPLALVGLARLRGVDRTIKAGNYEIEQGTTLARLLDKLTQGDVTQSAITIVEGTTFAELKALLRAHPQVAKTVVDLPDAELLAKLGADERHPEGLFFPDTYFFASGSTDLALLARAYRLLEQRLDAAWNDRAPNLPLATPYEALILASIVEKETGRAADRPLVASVFVNRLRARMRLQTDPSVIYGIGAAFDGNLRRRDLEADSPYNTYVRDGLPPTPIALPSQASLDAVTRPPDTPYLYFVARGDGASVFSVSLAEHNRAVAKYQKGGR
jgi:UPF0755 protein